MRASRPGSVLGGEAAVAAMAAVSSSGQDDHRQVAGQGPQAGAGGDGQAAQDQT